MRFQLMLQTMFAVSALTFIIPMAHAVQTKDCPATISIEVASMDLLSDAEIYRRSIFHNSDDEKQKRQDFNEHLESIREDVRLLGKVKKNTTLAIRERKNGVCEYKAGRFDAKLYTKDGKNLLRLDPVPGVAIFVDVRSHATDGLNLGRTDNRPVKAIYGDIGESGLGDKLWALLAFADLEIQ